MRLLLFDIDGTLIRSSSAGRSVMAYALEKVYGETGPIDTYRMGGKTDRRIIADLLTAVNISPATIEAGLPEAYRLMTEKGAEIFPEREMSVCPGVLELLIALESRPDAIVGLLTGNIESVAPLKLAAAGIEPKQFRLGAYGSDHADRNKLPQLAMKRASELTGCTFIGANTTIIGDTPADILCARAGNATAVAVASGWHAAHTLSDHHPDYLFESFTDTSSVLEALFNLRG